MFAASFGATIAFADQQPRRTARIRRTRPPLLMHRSQSHSAKCERRAAFAEMVSKTPWLETEGTRSFLTTGRGWLALFQGEKPGLHHYCYSIANYDPADAVARLKAPASRPDAKAGVCISTIRMALNVRSRVRDARPHKDHRGVDLISDALRFQGHFTFRFQPMD